MRGGTAARATVAATVALVGLLAVALVCTTSGCADAGPQGAGAGAKAGGGSAVAKPVSEHESATARQVARAAMAQVGVTVGYDASYVPLSYPGGDVPVTTGACSDVVVRAFRAVGVDLQVKLHEDMAKDFSAYPQTWGLKQPNPSIDQRRVPNLATYFTRQGKAVAVTANGGDYWPGDVVTWNDGGHPHCGVISTTLASDGTRFLVTHNRGAGAQTAAVLFAYTITGHYRFF